MNVTEKKIFLTSFLLFTFLLTSQARDFESAKSLLLSLVFLLIFFIGFLVLLASTFPTKYSWYNKFTIYNLLFLFITFMISALFLEEDGHTFRYYLVGPLFWFQVLSTIIAKVLQVREKALAKNNGE